MSFFAKKMKAEARKISSIAVLSPSKALLMFRAAVSGKYNFMSRRVKPSLTLMRAAKIALKSPRSLPLVYAERLWGWRGSSLHQQ